MFNWRTFAVALALVCPALANSPLKSGVDFKLAIHQSLFTSLSGIVREIFIHEMSTMELPDVTSTIPPLFAIPHFPSAHVDYSVKKIRISRVTISPESNVILKDKVAVLNIRNIGFRLSADYDIGVRNHPSFSDKGTLSIRIKGGNVRSHIKLGSNGRGGVKVAMESTETSLKSMEVDLKKSIATPIVEAFKPVIDLFLRPILTTSIGLVIEKVVPPIFNTILSNQLSIGLGMPNGESWDVHTEIVGIPVIDPDAISLEIALNTKHAT